MTIIDITRYLYQPYEVSIETLALCNAACDFCTYPTLERIGSEMPNELLKRLIEEMAKFEHPFYFSPFKVNEPFLDKRVPIICQWINEKVPLARLRLFTNGTPLTPVLIEKIAAIKNVEHLWVSLNSIDPDEYKKIMKLELSLTIKRLDDLHARAAADQFPHAVVVSRVAGSLGENAEFINYVSHFWPKFVPVIIKRDGWLGDINAPPAMIPDTPCSRWWELSICANGVVSLCCMDGHGKYSIGNVNESSMLSIYNDPKYQQRRAAMVSRKSVFPCATCSY